MVSDEIHTDEPFQVVSRIGQGTFGEIYKAVRTVDEKDQPKKVALKKVWMKEVEDGLPKHGRREIAALETVCHENVIRLLEYKRGEEALILVLELCRGDLYTLMKDYGVTYKPEESKSLVRQMLAGIEAIHAHGLMHRDIKTSNLLLDSAGCLKICDFGLCRKERQVDEKPLTWAVCTRWYKAPEILFGSKSYTRAVDLWSAGCCMAEIISGKVPFSGASDIDQICKVFAVRGSPCKHPTPWPERHDLPDFDKLCFQPMEPKPLKTILGDDAEDDACELLGALLTYSAGSRTSAASALGSKYFEKSKDEAKASDSVDLAGKLPQVKERVVQVAYSELLDAVW